MNAKHIAILIYGEPGSNRNALVEEKYKELAAAFSSKGYVVESVLYNDELAEKLASDLLQFEAVLVWVNPMEQGKDRSQLDALLNDISNKGCFVSAHPETILKIGTKEVLFTTKHMSWGGDIRLYRTFDEFKPGFAESLRESGTRVLKQYRGNGGNGVFKVCYDISHKGKLKVIHAKGYEASIVSADEMHDYFQPYFSNNGMLIDQPWNSDMQNGMVRCYVVQNKVAGFGYQEINALYETADGHNIPPGKRYYFSEHCGLFADLKQAMETTWIPQLQELFSIPKEKMPIIWDADFFIHDNESSPGKYTLCEINTSSVSPFPPSCIPHMVRELSNRLRSSAGAVSR